MAKLKKYVLTWHNGVKTEETNEFDSELALRTFLLARGWTAVQVIDLLLFWSCYDPHAGPLNKGNWVELKVIEEADA